MGGSLEAVVILYVESELSAKLIALGDELRFVLLIFGVIVVDYNDVFVDV